jgi:hypothetical protein
MRGSLSFWFLQYWIGIKIQSCFFGIFLGNVSCYATWRTCEFGGHSELNFVKTLGEQKEAFWDHSRLGVPHVYCNCISLWGNIISIIWVLLIALMSCITQHSLGKCRPKRNKLCLVKILMLRIPNTSSSALVIELVWVHAILACSTHACEFMSQAIPGRLLYS